MQCCDGPVELISEGRHCLSLWATWDRSSMTLDSDVRSTDYIFAATSSLATSTAKCLAQEGGRFLGLVFVRPLLRWCDSVCLSCMGFQSVLLFDMLPMSTFTNSSSRTSWTSEFAFVVKCNTRNDSLNRNYHNETRNFFASPWGGNVVTAIFDLPNHVIGSFLFIKSGIHPQWHKGCVLGKRGGGECVDDKSPARVVLMCWASTHALVLFDIVFGEHEYRTGEAMRQRGVLQSTESECVGVLM